ncbi:GNAT family N-acetyltransferase [Pseudomonas purpurea]|uniref:GNAT family N-acetyltransferase n=1 Tax=Pseudomonas purpurea TaxID=3136737 RepID=UPI0032667211
MSRIDWLENHMTHCDTMSAWVHAQFRYEFEDQPLADWQREFTAGQTNGKWRCLIAMDQDRLLGGAALARDDLAERHDLGPWLACVYVTPEARGQGFAEQLIEGICTHAKSIGITKLYLHTHDRRDYYAKRGWIVEEQFEAWDKEQWLMTRLL